jgi:hypothetical protein
MGVYIFRVCLLPFLLAAVIVAFLVVGLVNISWYWVTRGKFNFKLNENGEN